MLGQKLFKAMIELNLQLSPLRTKFIKLGSLFLHPHMTVVCNFCTHSFNEYFCKRMRIPTFTQQLCSCRYLQTSFFCNSCCLEFGKCMHAYRSYFQKSSKTNNTMSPASAQQPSSKVWFPFFVSIVAVRNMHACICKLVSKFDKII